MVDDDRLLNNINAKTAYLSLWSLSVMQCSLCLCEIVADVSPTVRPCPRCGQPMVIKQKKDSSG